MDYKNQIFNMDCLAGLSLLPDNSVDMVLTDLPYGTTSGAWDTLLPLPDLWRQLNRVTKRNGAMVFTAAQPFTTTPIASNPKQFRYCWYWIKNQVTGFPFSHFQPLRCVEEIAVFYRAAPTYNPQGLVALEHPRRQEGKHFTEESVYRKDGLSRTTLQRFTNYPRQILSFPCQREGLHPTQKPVALFEYLVRTYTDPGQLVLDCCIGSGTTKVACRNAGRDYVGFEIDRKYYEIAQKTMRGGGMDSRCFEQYVDKAIQAATAEHALPAGPVPTMTPDKLARLTAMLTAGRENVWYNSGDWAAVKAAVKKIDHNDCLICKAMGRRRAARIVHHVKHLRDRPDLALSIYDPDTGARQLISVCKDCHEMLHPEAQRQYRPRAAPLTPERWD